MKPEISIIIISWNLQDVIGGAISSAFAQRFASSEVIVVDNGSTDGSVEEIKLFSSTENCRYRFILNDTNIGLGGARNQGMDAAEGKYIAFLDGDDWFELDSLPPLTGLAKEHCADVTVFNHREVYSDGTVKANKHTSALWAGDRTAPGNRRQLFRNFNVAWNKIYRSGFLTAHELRFPDGLYEDVTWTNQVLILAERVAASDEVVVNYRKDRTGSITNTENPAHMQAIDRFRELLEFVEANQRTGAPYRQELFERITRNTLTLLSGKKKPSSKAFAPRIFMAGSTIA
ncbi:MAG: glycosyltransferase family 2 protein [Hyphomicrobiales bacterium]